MKLIKRCAAIFLTVLFFGHSASGGLILTHGQSFEFEFQAISIYSSAPLGNPPAQYANTHFHLGSDDLDSGDSLIFSVFENSTAEPVLRSGLFNGSSSGFTGGGFFLGDLPSVPWQDKQGVLRIEVVTGTVELDSFSVETLIGVQNYEQTYAIPEPNSVALFFIGTGIIYLRRKRFPNRLGLTRHNSRGKDSRI